MIFDSKTMVPQVYGKERQFQVFNKLLDIIMTCCKSDIDNLGNVYNAMLCPEELLPLLASNLNYQYNYNDTVSSNRNIIDIFATMEKWRGSELGLKMASALSLTGLNISKNNNELIFSNIDYINAIRDMDIEYNYEEARIEITYPNVYTLVRYLLDYVRPVGMTVKLKPVVSHTISGDAMLIFSSIEPNVHRYSPDVETFVNKSFVNFSSTADNKWIEEHASEPINLNL